MVDHGHGSSKDTWLTMVMEVAMMLMLHVVQYLTQNKISMSMSMVEHGHGSNNDALLTRVMEVQWMHG